MSMLFCTVEMVLVAVSILVFDICATCASAFKLLLLLVLLSISSYLVLLVVVTFVLVHQYNADW